jgi:hypothetical protein
VLPGWRVRRWRRRRAGVLVLLVIVIVLAFAVFARRSEIPRGELRYPMAHSVAIA